MYDGGILGLGFSAGFSICLRVSFNFLIEGYIFDSEHVSLVMRNYKAKLGGNLRVNYNNFMLQWPGTRQTIQSLEM